MGQLFVQPTIRFVRGLGQSWCVGQFGVEIGFVLRGVPHDCLASALPDNPMPSVTILGLF